MITATHNLDSSMGEQDELSNPSSMQLIFLGFADEIFRDIKHQGYCTDEQGGTPLLRGAVYQGPTGGFYAAYREGGYWNAGEWVDEFSTDDFNLVACPRFADPIAAAIEADRHADRQALLDRESAALNAVSVG